MFGKVYGHDHALGGQREGTDGFTLPRTWQSLMGKVYLLLISFVLDNET